MSIFNLSDNNYVGTVQAVDTASVVVKVESENVLSNIKVNNLIIIEASKERQTLIGMVNKIVRKFNEFTLDEDDNEEYDTDDIVKINLIGTLLDKFGLEKNIFKRTLESVPSIGAQCYIMDDENLASFMGVISSISQKDIEPLNIGTYALSKHASAYIDGNKFFQKHAVIVGSTGSGKSCTVATIIEQIAKLKSSNAILYDIHGEYSPIVGENIKHYRIAGPNDLFSDNVLFLPYWLLTYEEMMAMILDRGDNNAPNQAMLFSKTVINAKRDFLINNGFENQANDITIDSPVPYEMTEVIKKLDTYNTEMVPGANGKPKKGDYNGLLSRFIQRLENKINDKRLNFMFSKDEKLLDYNYVSDLCEKLMLAASCGGGIKIIDFSEVPSDILPLIVSLIARIIFSVQQWIDKDKIHPIAVFCDEAHLYIPQNVKQGIESLSLMSFERIAKEGRKYGVGLVVITQRPSEVDRTVLSQSSNFVAMRLTNSDDQNVIKKLLPDSLGNFGDLLPVLDVGEALVVGDASLLPSRILIQRPNPEPNSSTIKFWDEWSKKETDNFITVAVASMRKQSK